jgi:HK97 family phage major capsid protein
MNLTEMQDKRGQLVTEARSALDEIKTNTDEARATELEQRHDKIMGELDKLDTNIAREQRVAKLEKEAAEAREQRRPDQSGEGRGAEELKKPEYREAFVALARSGFNPAELSDEHRAALKAGVAEFRAQTAGTTTAGGYTVPTDLAATRRQDPQDVGSDV